MMANQESLSFTSLSGIRAAHLDLLRRFRAEAGHSDAVPGDLVEAATAFLHAVCRAGAMLDREAERAEAQSILDAWGTRLYRARHDVGDITLAEFDIDQAPALPDAPSPYLGLDTFFESQSTFFFGRDSFIEEQLARIEKTRFLAVLGPSGSGKSSLVYAGILPRLRHGALPGSAGWRYYPRMVPGSDPLRSLAQMLGDKGPEEEDARIAAFRKSPLALTSALESAGGTGRVMTIDQFEELFTLCLNPSDRAAFDANVAKAAGAAGNVIILTMRDDFTQRLPLLESLYSLIQTNKCTPGAFTAAELREAIERPAQLVGLKFDDGVVEALVGELIGEPAALPLLQVTLLRLWERRTRNRVTMETYREVGGGRRALANGADEFYESLIREDQELVRRIFGYLVRPGDGDAETLAWRIKREELYQIAAPEKIDRVLDRLVAARLVRLTRTEAASDAQVEVAHEALIRNWDHLIQWMREDRDRFERNKQLESRAMAWVQSGRTAGLLDAVSVRLYDEQAREKTADRLSTQAQELLAASRTEVTRLERARKWRLRVAIGGAFVFAILAAFAALSAYRAIRLRGQADRNASLAEQSQVRADEQRNLAIANWQKLTVEKTQLELTKVKLEAYMTTLESLKAQAEQKGRLHDATRFTGAALKSTDRDLSLLLAIHAAMITYGADRTIPDETSDALLHLAEGPRTLFSFGLRAPLNQAAFSPDGSRVAATEQDGTVQVWDGLTGQEFPVLRAGSVAFSLAFDVDNSLLVGSNDGAWLWGPRRDQPTHIGNGNVLYVAFSGDGRLIATAGATQAMVRFWDRSGRPSGANLELDGAPLGVAFSPDNKVLAVVVAASNDSAPPATRSSNTTTQRQTPPARAIQLKAFDFPAMTQLFAVPVPDRIQDPLRMRFASLGAVVDVVWETGAVQSFSVPTGRSAQSSRSDYAGSRSDDVDHPNVFARALRRFDPSPDGRRILVDGQTLRVQSNPSRANGGPESRPMTAISPDRAVFNDAGTVALGVEDDDVEVLDLASDKPLLESKAEGVGHRVALSSDGRTAVVSGRGLSVFRIHAGGTTPDKSKPVVLDEGETYVDVAVSADGTRVVGATGRSVVLWELAGPIRTVWTYAATRVTISRKGDVVAAAGPGGVVSLRPWGQDASRIRQLPGAVTDQVERLVFDPAGSHLAASGQGGLLLWDTLRPSEPAKLTSVPSFHAAFSSSGELIAVVQETGAIVWNVATKKQNAGHSEGRVRAVGFSADSTRLLSMDTDGEVSATPVNGTGVMAEALARLARGWTHEECTQYLEDRNCEGDFEAIAAIVDGNNEAKQPDGLQNAVKKYREALSLKPFLPLTPDAQAKRVRTMIDAENRAMRVAALVQGAPVFMFRDDADRTVRMWTEALRLDPEAAPQIGNRLVPVVNYFATAQGAAVALRLLESAARDLPSLSGWKTGYYWNELCYRASLFGVDSARVVKSACDAAVSADPTPNHRDSRAVNRTLLGDYAGAIDDFQVFVSATSTSTANRKQREGYIASLRAGQNPLTAEELTKLRAAQ